MAGWMKTPLGMEVDLGAAHIVLDGVPAPVKGAQQPPLFGPCLLWPRSPISATAELLLFCLSGQKIVQVNGNIGNIGTIKNYVSYFSVEIQFI